MTYRELFSFGKPVLLVDSGDKEHHYYLHDDGSVYCEQYMDGNRVMSTVFGAISPQILDEIIDQTYFKYIDYFDESLVVVEPSCLCLSPQIHDTECAWLKWRHR